MVITLRSFTLVVAVALVFGQVAVGSVGAQTAATLCDQDVEPLIDEYNANVDAVPGLVKGMVVDETVHVTVEGDSTRDFTAVTDSAGRVTEFKGGEPDSPTLAIRTDCETVGTVVGADDPVAAFQSEYDDGEISISGVGIVNAVVIGAVKAVVGIARTLGLL